MKKLIFIIITSTIFFSTNGLISLNGDFHLIMRNIKLAGSYRAAKDYDNSFRYLNLSQKALHNNKSKEAAYWKAAVKEGFALTYRDIGMYQEALKYIDSAITDFKRIITQPDGSPLPLSHIKEQLNDLIFNREQIKPLNIPQNILNLDNQKLKEIPSTVPAGVENLSLANNKFKNLPNTLSRFNNMKYLDLSDNKIRDGRFNFTTLTNLIWLDLSNNKIKELDESISELKNLNFLDLSGNNMKNIPVGICNLKSLKILNLKDNKIPFEQIANLIKCMPNTNILYDIYVLKGDEEEGL